MELLFVLGAVTLAAFIIVFWKKPLVKKYWKYALILLPGMLFLILKAINDRNSNDVKDDKKKEEIRNKIDAIKEDIQEAQLEAAVEVSVAKAKSEEKLKELKEIKKIKDKKERRKKLASLIG